MLQNNVNKYKSKQVLQGEEAQAIAEREQYDLKLYEIANELFEASLRQFPEVEKLSDKIAGDNDFYRLYLKVLNKWKYL